MWLFNAQLKKLMKNVLQHFCHGRAQQIAVGITAPTQILLNQATLVGAAACTDRRSRH
jgi:hypothetical protein